MRLRRGRSLNPLSSTKTMIRPSFWAFFSLRPALLFPAADLFFVPLQPAAGRTLRRPAQLPQDAPSLHRGELLPAFALDQVRHAPGGPQTGFVSQRFRAALQLPHDAFQLSRAQARLAPGATGTLERLPPAALELFGPAAHRLPVHAHPAGHLGLRHSLAQQLCA